MQNTAFTQAQLADIPQHSLLLIRVLPVEGLVHAHPLARFLTICFHSRISTWTVLHLMDFSHVKPGALVKQTVIATARRKRFKQIQSVTSIPAASGSRLVLHAEA